MRHLKAEPRLEPLRLPMMPECPACVYECSYYFLDINRSVIACDNCKGDYDDFDSVVDAWDWSMT